MADKEVPLAAQEKPDNTEKGEKETAHSSDESGRVTDTDKSSESSNRSTETSSGIELKFEPESSKREATSPEPATEVVSGKVSHSKSPLKSALKLIAAGTSKALRKISPKKHERRERSKSPEREEAAQAEVEPFMTGELELSEESLSKTARKQDVDLDVASKHPDSKKSDDDQTITAKQRRERFAHKLPDGAEIGKWTGVRITVDTNWSRTTDQSIAGSLDFSESEVFTTTTRRMSENLDLSEHGEKGGCFSETASETDKKNISVSPRKTPVKRQMPLGSQQEEEMGSPSLSKRLTLQKDKSESID